MCVDLRVKHDIEARKAAIGLFERGHGSESAAKALSVPRDTVRQWLYVYRSFGSEVLLSMDGKQVRYTYEQKVAAASAVVDGGMSGRDAMEAFGVMSLAPLKLGSLLECAGLARSSYYYALAHPPRPTRPELRDAVAEIFSRTANGCGHRQVAMCPRAELGARIADKTVLKMMRETGVRCGIRRETDYHRYNSSGASWARHSRTSSGETSPPTGRGRRWAPTSPSSSSPGARPTSRRCTTSAARR